MTTAPSTESAMTVFRRALAAEWTRLVTVRTTWWSLLAATGLMLFIGGAAGLGHDGGAPAPVWVAAQTALVPAQFFFLVVVLLAVTGEFATGAVRSTLQWTPRREIVLAARTLVPVVFAALCAVVAATATDLLAWGFLGDAAEVIPRDIAASLGRIALVILFGSALAVGIGLFLRNTAGSLAAIFVLLLALPIALGNSGVSWLVTVSDYLPGRVIVTMLVSGEISLPPGTVATVMIAWSTVALVAGGWSLISRDTA